MLVGIANGTKLLGVGVPDATGTDGLGGIDITVGTTAITFKVTALTADIGVPDEKDGSGAVITSGTSGDLTLTSNLASSINKPEANFDMDGTLVPYFKLAENTTGITGTFTIRGFSAVKGLVDVVSPSVDAIGSPVYIAGAGKATMLGVTPSAPTAVINSATGDLDIGFTLAVSGEDGLKEGFSRLRLGASVKAFGAAGNGSVWNVSNGLENGYDLGVAPNSIGRDILFYVGALTPSDGSDAENEQVVSKLDLTSLVPAPSFNAQGVGATPVMSLNGDQYIGTVIWNPSHEAFASTSVRYTATVILWARENFTFIDPDNGLVQFIHGGLGVTDSTWSAGLISTQGNGSGVTVTITFPNSPPIPVEDLGDGGTVPGQSMDLDLTYYIPAPGVDERLTMFFSPSWDTYTVKSITWSPLDNPAVGGVVYTAKVILTAKPGYTFSGVTFKHDDATPSTQDNGNETVTVTLKFLKTKTTATSYVTGGFSDGIGSYISAIDSMRAHAGYDSLRITLSAAGATTYQLSTMYDIGTGLVLNLVDYPANISISGANRTMTSANLTANPFITVGAGVTLTLTNMTFNGNTGSKFPFIKVADGGTFILGAGATIGNNKNTTTGGDGGGVYVADGGTFILRGGTISGNTTATGNGGGVFVEDNGTFIMEDGAISGNTATGGNGGGVYLEGNATFIKTGGNIYGTGDAYANTAVDGSAVYVEGGAKKRNATADESTTMDSTKDGPAGGWL